MNNDLIERYIYAVTKHLPLKTREDISEELTGLISDMLEERCGELPPSEKDIRVVLTELGTPKELAEKYSPDKNACLIGPPYFTEYKMILKIITACVAFGLTLALIISGFMSETPVHPLVGIFNWLYSIISAELSCFAILTIIFAIFQRKGVAVSGSDLSDLPPVPKNNNRFSKFDSIALIIISVIFGIVFLAVPQIFPAILTDEKRFIPIFDTAEIHSLWLVILACALIGIAKGCFRLYEKFYTKRIMIFTCIANVLSAVLTFLFLHSSKIMNREFVSYMQKLLYNEDFPQMSNFFTDFNLFFMGIIFFALILDTITVIYRTLKYAQK